MSFPANDLDYPPLGDLSLNVFDNSDKCWAQSMNPDRLLWAPHTPQSSPSKWSVPEWQSPSASSSTWNMLLPPLESIDGSTDSQPSLYMPGLNYCESITHSGDAHGDLPPSACAVPPSPSDTSSSSVSTDIASSTPPPFPLLSASTSLLTPWSSPHPPVHIVQCNAPLIAPKPLPYHSPTFLQFVELPDLEEDLSHPPYTQRSSKRKRDDTSDDTERSVQKRRAFDTYTCSVPLARSGSRSVVLTRNRHPGSMGSSGGSLTMSNHTASSYRFHPQHTVPLGGMNMKPYPRPYASSNHARR